MECLEVEGASTLEDDLDLSDNETPTTKDHWPELPKLTTQHGNQQSTSSSSSKRRADDSSSEECHPPVAKTAKCAPLKCVEPAPQPSVSTHCVVPPSHSKPMPQLPAFAPREDYVRLSFDGNPSTDTKLRWLSAVHKAFQLQRDLAEVKMAAVTSRFVYVSRQRTDILARVQTGEFLSLPLVPHDSPERPRKLPSFILTRYPVEVEPSLAKDYPGVYSARRFFQDGSPIPRIVIVWSHPDPPPATICFDFLIGLPPCEVRKLHNDKPWCYKCWGIGHISKYCTASPRCAWCARGHDTRTCPVRNEASRQEDSSTTSEPPPSVDESQ